MSSGSIHFCISGLCFFVLLFLNNLMAMNVGTYIAMEINEKNASLFGAGQSGVECSMKKALDAIKKLIIPQILVLVLALKTSWSLVQTRQTWLRKKLLVCKWRLLL